MSESCGDGNCGNKDGKRGSATPAPEQCDDQTGCARVYDHDAVPSKHLRYYQGRKESWREMAKYGRRSPMN
jgi:hypothetical protein